MINFILSLVDSFYQRWKPFDPSRNWPDLGPRFASTERKARHGATASTVSLMAGTIKSAHTYRSSEAQISLNTAISSTIDTLVDLADDDNRDLDWAAVLKRTFESFIRGERPNVYGEWLIW